MSTITSTVPSLFGSTGALAKLRRENQTILEKLRPKGLPLLFGEEDLEMGESSVHTRTCEILHYGVDFHLANQRDFRVFSNLNLHYSVDDPALFVSPDLMVVKLPRSFPDQVSSYHLGRDGPSPSVLGEVLSFRTYQQGDLSQKPVLYAAIGVQEYILVDVTGEMLERRLLILRRQKSGIWKEEQDKDGGVTSQLGFRLRIDADGHLRVVNAKTGKVYARPEDAQTLAERLEAAEKARDQAERRLRALEAEVKARPKRRKKKD